MPDNFLTLLKSNVDNYIKSFGVLNLYFMRSANVKSFTGNDPMASFIGKIGYFCKNDKDENIFIGIPLLTSPPTPKG